MAHPNALYRAHGGAQTADWAAAELDAFEEKWSGKFASIGPAWRRAWQEVIPLFAFDPANSTFVLAVPLARDSATTWRVLPN